MGRPQQLPELDGIGWDPLSIGDLGFDPEDATRLTDEIKEGFRKVAAACVDPKTSGKGKVTIEISFAREGKAVHVEPSVKLKVPGRCRPGTLALVTKAGEVVTQGGRQIDLADLLREARKSNGEGDDE